MQSDLTPDLLRTVEARAHQVLAQLKTFLDQLRSISKQIGSKDERKLPKKFIENTKVLLKEVHRTRESIDTELGPSPSFPLDDCCCSKTKKSSDLMSQTILGGLVPILHNLSRCYAVLDRAPAPVPQPRNKPTAPVGMLSVQQYTDVAIGLELLAQTGIEPYLELKNTSRHIPRTLKGRYPEALQRWCCEHLSGNSDGPNHLLGFTLLLAELISLDRFRPMLDRHVPDMYSALLQLDHDDNLPLAAQAMVLQFGLVDTPSTIVSRIVQAKSLQWLLRHGMKAPSWFRQAIGTHLANLSCRDLPVVTQAFVGSFPAGMQSAAVARLSQTLISPPSGMEVNQYYEDLVEQIWSSLDQVGLAVKPEKVIEVVPIEELHRQINHAQQNVIDTARTVLEQLPSAQFDRLLPALVRACEQPDGIHKVVRRLAILLLNYRVPSQRLRDLFLSRIKLFEDDSPATGTNMIGLIVRVASLNTILKMMCKEDAVWALRSWVHCFTNLGEHGESIVAASLVHSLAPFSGDMAYSLVALSPKDEVSTPFDMIRWGATEESVDQVARDIERRANVLAIDILQRMCSTGDDVESEEEPSSTVLPSMVFQLVLTIYFSSGMQADHSLSLSTPQEHICSVLFRCEIFHIVALVLLPVLCESCSPDSLLRSMTNKTSGILDLVRLCLSMASHRFGVWRREDMESSMLESVRAYDTSGSGFMPAAKALRSLLNIADAPSGGFDDEMTTSDEMLLSITSIMMTLLIGILELGAEKRSLEDESLLKTFTKSLKPLALLPVGKFDSELSPVRSQLAEVSSHAIALIAARQVSDLECASLKDNSFSARLEQANRDLKSSEPPLRARGVVSLRHLAASLEEQTDKSRQVVSEKETEISRLGAIVKLSFLALSDGESYVYLAAIQTLVALADLKPNEMVGILTCALAHGKLKPTDDEAEKVTVEQRIKVGEILIFFFRRRATIYHLLPGMFDMLIFGTKTTGNARSIEQSFAVAKESHDYFLPETATTDSQDEEESTWEEIETRLKTGGPLFQIEEQDVLRSSMINVIAEAIMVSPPAVCKPYLKPLVHCAVTAMQLEASRVVRRASALLARELYNVTIREGELSVIKKQVCRACATALVVAGEERLHDTLNRCVSGDDIGDLRDEQGRMYDSATRSRCLEALSYRREAEESGLLAAGQIVADYQEMQEKSTLFKLVDASSTTVDTTGTMSTHIRERSTIRLQ